MGDKLQFDEFQAITKRQQKEAETNFDDAGTSSGKRPKVKKNTTPKKNVAVEDEEESEYEEEEPASSNFFERAGSFIEMSETQVVVSCLILADVASSLIVLLSECGTSAVGSLVPSAIIRLLRSFTDFTVFIFLLELLLILVAFGPAKVLGHPGYLLDMALVGAAVACDVMALVDTGLEIRLLGLLRLWRLVRLNGTLMQAGQDQLSEVIEAALADREKLARLTVEAARLEDTAKADALSRKRIEHMCRAYKDEVDTLNEALKIAARDIAEAAGSELESEEEGEGEEEEAKPRAKKQPNAKFVVDENGAFAPVVE